VRTLAILLALTASALAQPQPQPATLNQALSQKLLEEVNANIQLRVQLIEALARIKQLEEKPQDRK
jgi:hypothetical protein